MLQKAVKYGLAALFCVLCLVVLVLSLSTIPGCVTVARVEPTTQSAEQGLHADVYDATRGYLHFAPGRTDQVRQAAQRVKHLAASDIDAETIRREVVLALLDRSHLAEADRQTIEFLTDILISRVKRRLGLQIDVNIATADQLPRLRSMLVIIADAAIQACDDSAR